MKKLLYSAAVLTLLSSALFIGGCKKTAAVDGHVASITTAGVVSTFSYDGQGRLTTYTDASGSVSFTYSPSSVTAMSNGNTVIFPLNNQGYASSGLGLTYSYDNNGYLIAMTANGNSENFAVSDGNITSITEGSVTSDVYTYLTNTDYRNYGVSFLGKAGAKVTSTGVFPLTHNLYGTDTEGAITYQYSYTYDSKGRVQTQTVTGNGGTTTSVYAYTTN